MIPAINNLIQPHLASVPILFTTPGTVVAMFLNIYIAKVFQAVLSIALLTKYDHVQANHRSVGDVKDGKKPGFAAKMVQRAFNAHQNSWEAFAGFSVAVVLALQMVGDSPQLNMLANWFVLVRFAYILIYIVAFNNALAMFRSAAWVVGLSIILQIFVLAAGDKWKSF